MTNREFVDAAWAEVMTSTISGSEWQKRVTFGYKGKPFNWQNTAYGRAKLLLDQVADCPVEPLPPGTIVTGCHWPDTTDFPTLKQTGYGFAVVTCPDVASAKAKCDAAAAAGLNLIIGAYPEPYTLTNGVWTISTGGVQILQYLATRTDVVIGLFVFNEPYWVNGYTAQQLRDLRTKIRTVWPTAKVYHDLGQPQAWTASGYIGAGRTQWNDQSGVADLVGVWDYPFKTTGYEKQSGLATLAREIPFIVGSMGATPVWLGQSHGGVDGLAYPTDAQISDWNQAVRAALPASALISWYVWRQSIYPDVLAGHPSQWPLTVGA